MAAGHLTLTPEIDHLRRQFEQMSAEADTLAMSLSEAQFAWQPAPDAWSVAQCLEHLNITAREYLPVLDAGIADAITRGRYGPGPFRTGILGHVMLWGTEPPARLRLRAPRAFTPVQSRARAEILAGFRAYQVQFIDRLRQANGLDLARARVGSPVARWIRFSLGAGFALMAAHERRHLAQARGVTQRADFPRS